MRSVIESGLLSGLSNTFEVDLALEKGLFSTSQVIKQPKVYFSTAKINHVVTNLLMDSGTWKYRNRSSSFQYRIKRRLMGDALFKNLDSRNKAKYPFRFAKNISRYIFLGHGFTNFVLQVVNRGVQRREHQIRNILIEINPDIVLIWSQTLDPGSSAFIYLSKKLTLPHVLIADNWDNLFSKTVFPIKPDLIGCFGDQSADFGSLLHNIPRHRFIALGSARFDIYRNLPKQNSRQLVIFAGSSMPQDDERILKLMDQVRIDFSKRNPTQHLHWRYRPHPVPQHRVSSFIESLPNIEFTNLSNRVGENQWPRLNDSVLELANSRVAICMPTSYLLESLVCEVPVIIPIFKEMIGLTSAKVLMKSLAHLDGIEKLPGVFIATSPNEFKDQLTELLGDDIRIAPNAQLDYFVNWSQQSFRENLTDLVKTVTGNGPSPHSKISDLSVLPPFHDNLDCDS